MTRTKTSKHRLVNGHMEWTGPTLRAAQAARDETLNRLFANCGAEIPVLITASPGRQGLVFQRSDGYFSYRLIRDGVEGGISIAPFGKTEAERACRRHLAQDVFELQDAWKFVLPKVAFDEHALVRVSGLDVIAEDDEEGRVEHRRWIAFQVAYAKARAAGESDIEAHRAASST